MHIVFVSNEFPPQIGGGIGTYVAAMSHALSRRGHRVTVVADTPKRYPLRERVDGVDVIRLPLTIAHGPEPMATLKAWQGRAEAVAAFLDKLVGAQTVDLVEFPDYRAEGLSYLSTTEPERRPVCIVRLHTPLSVLNAYNRMAVRHRVLESLEDQALLWADRVVSPSAALANELRRRLPDMPGVDLSPHPVDPAFLEDSVDPAADAGGDILYVGRLEERKGVEVLIKAAPAILSACGEARIVLAGGDLQVADDIPSMRAHLISMLPDEYRDRVVFLGRIDREAVRARYAAARLCVFPSLFENFPNTCLEAMAMGRPVVGTDNSGMAEMIEPDVSGMLARSGDVDDLAAKVIQLFQLQVERRREMGLAARQRVRQAYHPSAVARQVERLYESYLATPPELAPARKDDRPKVAVVVPCYNHGQFIRETLSSVDAQAWPNVAVVVVDDGSNDPDTVRVLDELKREGVSVIRQENQGLSAARNTGVRATDATFFVPLDADDRITPDFISKLIEPMLADPTLGYCYSHARFIGAASGTWECKDYDPRKLLVENLSVATAVVRREAFDLAGGYSRDMVHGFEDWDLWLALLAVGYHGRCVHEPLFEYRKHASGQSMLARTQQYRAEMIHQMVQHHRALFASMLEVSMSDKDAMFYSAHTEAWQLREALARRPGGSPPTPVGDPLFQSLAAQAELDHIENSRAWRTVLRLKQNAAYRLWSRAMHGAECGRIEDVTDPRERLAMIKHSRFYRLIQAMKRTSLYRAYARRKYGEEIDTEPGR